MVKLKSLFSNKLAFIVLLSLAVQLLFLSLVPLHSPKKDAVTYDAIGFNIAMGKGFSLDGKRPIALYPLYPMFLSLIYIMFGHNYFIVQVFLALVLAISCGVLYLLGRAVFNERTGLVTAILMSIYPPFFALSRIMYPEPLFILLLHLSIFLLILFCRNARLPLFFLSSILLGLTILTKPQAIFIPLIASIFLLCSFPLKKGLTLGLIFNIIVFLCLAPWIVRNYLLFKEFSPDGTLAIRDGRIERIGIAAEYDKEKTMRKLNLDQQNSLISYYAKANIKPNQEIEKNFFDNSMRDSEFDYTGNPRNALDLMKKMFITSYSDVLDIGIPFKAFMLDKNLVKHYFGILMIKTLNLAVSFFIFILATVNMLLSLRQNRDKLFLALVFISYVSVFYIYVKFCGHIGICGRYGLPVLGIVGLFVVDLLIRIGRGIRT